MLFVICLIILYLPISIFFPTKIKFADKTSKKIIKKEKCVLASNHMSALDPLVMQVRLRKKISFLAKIELFKNKFISFILKSFGAIPVDRRRPQPSAFKTCLDVLENGKPLCIFIQGTRKKSPIVNVADAKNGAVMFALAQKSPIIPVAFSKKVKLFHFRKIIVGKPIYLDYSRVNDKIYIEQMTTFVVSEINKLLSI